MLQHLILGTPGGGGDASSRYIYGNLLCGLKNPFNVNIVLDIELKIFIMKLKVS